MNRFLFLVVVGCAKPTAPVAPPSPALPPVTLCKTTEAELRSALGTPTRDGVLHDERVISWIIGRGSYDVIRYLAVLVDTNGIVVDRVWNVPSEVAWVPASQCAK